MSFPAFSPVLALALLAAIGTLIVLLHLLKPRRRQVLVASTLLWASVAKRHPRRDRLWRWWLSLTLCLVVGLALGLALILSQLPGATGGVRTVLVLDNSPSMAARTQDGKTRWLHAVERARPLIDAAGRQILLLDTMGEAAIGSFASRAEAMAALERLRVPTHGAAQMPALPADANLALHVLTDGVAAIDFPEHAVVHSVFEPADNVAVTALEVRAFPADPLRYEAFVQVYNASPGSKHARLSLRGGERFALAQELDLAPGELVDAAFDVSGFQGGVLAAAALAADDAYSLDDVAFAMVPAHRTRQVVLVTHGNAALEDCLRSLTGFRVQTLAPAAYRNDLRADAYVFDSFAPAEPPRAAALLFSPPGVSWLPAVAHEVIGASVADWDRAHPLTDGVSWRDLRIKRAAVRVSADAPQHNVVSAQNGALIVTGKAAAPWIVVGFAPQASNLVLQPGFPILVGNALAWLNNVEPPVVRGIGTVHVPLSGASVVDGNGTHVAGRSTPDGTVFDAARPDVYTVRAGTRQLKVVANVLDTRMADINHSRFADQPSLNGRSLAPPRQPAEPWTLLLLLGTALLLLEWTAYMRRITR